MLKVVQGDVLEFVIMLCRIDPIVIERVTFQCKDLGLEQVAEQEDDIYRIRILGEITKNFPIGFSRYDIAVTLTDGEQLTVKHNDKIEVLKKVASEVQNE